MLPKNQRNKLLTAFLFSFLASLLISFISYFDFFKTSQLLLSNNLYSSRNLNEDIIIVGVDERSLSDSQGLGDYTAWNRSYFAKVLENINKYNPKVVAFDFRFIRKKDEVTDLQFQKALEKTSKPIIIHYGNPSNYVENKGYFIQKKNSGLIEKPLDIFIESKNTVLSVANILLDEDTVARRIMPIIFNEETNEYHENFAFAIARRTLADIQLPEIPNISNNHYNLQSLNIPLEKGQMLINYATEPGKTYKNISFLDVYNNNFSPNLFENKIVLIGPTALYFKDTFYTPFSNISPIFGVEIQANALQTILDQNFLRNVTQAEKIIFIIIITALASFIFMFTKIRYSLIFLITSATLYTLAAPLAFKQGIIFDLIHPYLILIAVFIAVYMYRYLTEFKDKIQLKVAFSKYVNPNVVEQIIDHPELLQLGGKKQEVTVLFTDIAHFTTISENLKPESLVALLNEYFEKMSQVILQEGGTLDKFEGDAIMAFFGAPILQKDHALKACNTALKMRTALNELLEKWKKDPPLPGGESKPIIDFRCGIASGEVIVGNLGSSFKFDYTVIGDIVNLGSRLEGTNKKYETHNLISEETFNKIKDHFETREIDTIKVVGKNHPVKVYELLNTKEDLLPEAAKLLQLYNQGIFLYHQRKFAEALLQFEAILKDYPSDGPSKLYQQRCEVLRDYPPKKDWDFVFEMGTK